MELVHKENQVAQSKTHNIFDFITELTVAENTHLRQVLKDPVVVKYFKNVAYAAITAQAFIPIDHLVANSISPEQDLKFRIDLAYQKGILSIAETILNNIPKE